MNLKSLAVAAGSGFISGAMAASPLSIGWQIGGGAVVGAVSYAVDCKVNDKPVEGDELFFAAVGGGISGAIGGSGANEHLELTKDIMESLDHVAELSLKKVVTCTAKRIIAGNLCQNNKVAAAATIGSVFYTFGAWTSSAISVFWKAVKTATLNSAKRRTSR